MFITLVWSNYTYQCELKDEIILVIQIMVIINVIHQKLHHHMNILYTLILLKLWMVNHVSNELIYSLKQIETETNNKITSPIIINNIISIPLTLTLPVRNSATMYIWTIDCMQNPTILPENPMGWSLSSCIWHTIHSSDKLQIL